MSGTHCKGGTKLPKAYALRSQDQVSGSTAATANHYNSQLSQFNFLLAINLDDHYLTLIHPRKPEYTEQSPVVFLCISVLQIPYNHTQALVTEECRRPKMQTISLQNGEPVSITCAQIMFLQFHPDILKQHGKEKAAFSIVVCMYKVVSRNVRKNEWEFRAQRVFPL